LQRCQRGSQTIPYVRIAREQTDMLPLDKSIIDHLPGCIGWKNLELHYVGANRRLLNVKGVQCLEDLFSKTDEELSPESIIDNQMFREQDLRVLNGEKILTAHEDSNANAVYILEKNPIIQNDIITGLIYYCRPWKEMEIFHLLQKLDKKFDLNIKNYTLDHHQNLFKLTERECECIFLMLRGKMAKEIAAFLSLSKRTVESYIENIKNKMNCRNKTEIVVKALLSGYQNQIPSRLNHSTIIKSL
jgi:DNA-binding CsgD family transcriptional regulator